MKANNEKYGLTAKQWRTYKKEAQKIMMEAARDRQMITYSAMAARMTTLSVAAHDQVLWDIIGDVAKDEEREGRGLLSAVVVHKHGDMEPGSGFFELTKYLKRDCRDQTKCWIEELKKVYAVWNVDSSVRTSKKKKTKAS